MKIVWVLFILLWSCSFKEDIAGKPGVDETSNGISFSVLGQDGQPVTAALVRVRPLDYYLQEGLANQQANAYYDGISSDSGRVILPELLPGNYALEVIDGAFSAIQYFAIDSNTQEFNEIIDTVIIAPSASIQATIQLPPGYSYGYVYVVGTDHVAQTNSDGSFSLPGIPAGELALRVVLPQTNVTVLTGSVVVEPAQVVEQVHLDVVPKDYLVTDSIRVFLKISQLFTGNGSALVENQVPLLLRLEQSNFPMGAGYNGAGIRITHANGDTVPFEIAYWNESRHQAHIWVLPRTLPTIDNEHFLTLYWGQQGVYSASNPVAVWDTAMWSGAWHLTNGYWDKEGRLRSFDATVHGEHAVLSGTQFNNDGVFSTNGLPFAGMESRLSIGGTSVNLGGDFLTLQMWIKTKKAGCIFLDKQDTSLLWDHREKIFYLGKYEENIPHFGFAPTWLGWGDPDNVYFYSDTDIVPNEWVHLTLRRQYNEATQLVEGAWFINGEQVSTNITTFTLEGDAPEDSLRIGNHELERVFEGSAKFCIFLTRACIPTKSRPCIILKSWNPRCFPLGDRLALPPIKLNGQTGFSIQNRF
jgi:hypothetical protein